jgi:hypothetical protein
VLAADGNLRANYTERKSKFSLLILLLNYIVDFFSVHAIAAEQPPARVSRDPGHSQPDRVRGSLLLTRQAGPAPGTSEAEVNFKYVYFILTFYIPVHKIVFAW